MKKETQILSKFFLGFIPEGPEEKFPCAVLLGIKDEMAQFEMAEFLHSKKLLQPKFRFDEFYLRNYFSNDRIVENYEKEKAVKWLVENGYKQL